MSFGDYMKYMILVLLLLIPGRCSGGWIPMTLSEAQQKRLNDLAIGKIVTGQIPVDDQIAAIKYAISETKKL